MAYISQERKQEMSPAIKAVLKKFGVKGSLAVRNRMVLALNIKSGSVDFITNFNETVSADYYLTAQGFTPAVDNISVNPYHYDKHFSGQALAFLNEVMDLMNSGNHDNSDIQSDYFDVGWYVDVNIGKWNQAYVVSV